MTTFSCQEPIRATDGAYLNKIASRVASRFWWLLIPLLLLALWGLACDWRWALVALMLIFIVFPMAMTLTILKYAASKKLISRSRASWARYNDSIIELFDSNDSLLEHYTHSQAIFSKNKIIFIIGNAPDDIIII